jgi:hypothetical protein
VYNRQFVHNYIEQDSRKYLKILKTKFVGIKVVNFAQLCRQSLKKATTESVDYTAQFWWTAENVKITIKD